MTTQPDILAELRRLHDLLKVPDCGAGGPWDQEPIADAIALIESLRAEVERLDGIILAANKARVQWPVDL